MTSRNILLGLTLLLLLSGCATILGEPSTEWTRVQGGGSDSCILDLDPYPVIPNSVIKEDSQYKMWFQHYWGTSYATSHDGKIWTKVNGTGQLGHVLEGKSTYSSTGEDRFDSYLTKTCRVIKDGSTYKMWYIGDRINEGIWRIGYAESSDGINWNKVDGNGYLNSIISYEKQSDESYANIESFHVLKDGTVYKMWYIVYKNVGSPIKQIRTLYYLTSNDGVTWETQNQKDYDVLTSNNLDSFIGGEMSIIKDDNKYYMFYSGSYYSFQGIGCASSGDGINWTQIKGTYKFGALLVNNTKLFDKDGVVFPCVIRDGNQYMMWYSGVKGEMDTESHLFKSAQVRMGLATSPATQQNSLAILAEPQTIIAGLGVIAIVIGVIYIRKRR